MGHAEKPTDGRDAVPVPGQWRASVGDADSALSRHRDPRDIRNYASAIYHKRSGSIYSGIQCSA